MFKSKQNTLTKEEVTKISESVYRQMAEKQADEANKGTMTTDQIKQLSESLSKEIIVRQSEEMMNRMKKYCDADEKIDTIGRMAFIINECNTFTKEFVTEMLSKIFNEK